MRNDFFKGQVLRGAKVASSNSPTTVEPTSGVSRHNQSFDLSQAVVDIRADQYRSAVLDKSSESREEFLVWSDKDSSLTEARFWWTKNDTYTDRFAWNGGSGRWEPLKGGSLTSLGVLKPTVSLYTLSPKLKNQVIGQHLEGGGDVYSVLRVGSKPNSASYSVNNTQSDFSGVLIVDDSSANSEYFFNSTTPPLAGVIGSVNNVLVLNPQFIESYVGASLWYSARDFDSTSNGLVGDLGQELFVSPIPFLNERPMIRIGNRQHMTVVLADNDLELDTTTINEGQVGLSASTGQLKFNALDLSKADPQSPDFDVLFLNSRVFYDGVTCNSVAQPIRASVNLVDGNGNPVTALDQQRLFIPNADLSLGLGVSGVLNVPDKTGVVPSLTPQPQIKPNGSGLVRQVFDSGDAYIYTSMASIEKINVVPTNSDLPQFEFNISSQDVIVSREASVQGSEVKLSKSTRRRFQGLPIYFTQAVFTPAFYARKARIFSRVRDTFTFSGTETLSFEIDGSTYQWNALSGTFTAPQIASSIDSVISGSGKAYSLSGRVVLESANTSKGSVRIGYLGVSQGDTEYLSGLAACRALGFLPAWSVNNPSNSTGVATDQVWLPDTGSSLGMFRTPVNITGDLDTPDVKAVVKIDDEIISNAVSPLIFQFLDKAPLEDISGYDTGKFFKVVDGQFSKVLDPYVDVEYLFSDRKFAWLSAFSQTSVIERPTSALSLGQFGVLSESLSPILGGQFEVSSDGGVYGALTLDQDYTLPFDGDSGVANLIKRYGGSQLSGSRGRFNSGSDIFTDTTSDFSSVSKGYRLKIMAGVDSGSYRVAEVNGSNSLTVTPSFINGDGGSNTAWELFEGVDQDKIDSTILADAQFKPFEHLSEEPFKIQVIRSMGETGTPDLLFTDPSKAIELGRKVSARVGLNGPPLGVLFLKRVNLGTIINGSLKIPDVTNTRFATNSFSVLVGSDLFSHDDGSLVGVLAFTGDPTRIEYLNNGVDAGLLNFGSDVLSELTASTVTYVENLRPSSALPVNSVEIDPQTGYGSVHASNTGEISTKVYFAQEMFAGTDKDVTINPLGGSLNFTSPLQKGDLVEVSYTVAKPDGTQKIEGNTVVEVTEFLPFFIFNEKCVRVDPTNYSFNSELRTVNVNVDADVYTGARLKTYGSKPEVTVSYSENFVTFDTPIDASDNVTINYAVFEANGGETSFTVSTPPIYRPSFTLEANQTSFVLNSAREDIQAGQILSLGNQKTYIKSVVIAGDQTTVEVSPAFVQRVGSLSPGNDTSNLITDRPISPVVDLLRPISTEAPLGIFPTIQNLFNLPSGVYFEPVPKGSTVIRFQGNLTAYVKEGHALDVNGIPFEISSSKISEDGLWTETNIFPAAPVSLNPLFKPTRVSTRAIYLPEATKFQGLGPLVADEPFELVLFGEVDDQGRELSGRTLLQKVDYEIDTTTGTVTFLQPRQKSLQPNQTIYLSHTRLGVLSPFLSQGVLQKPRYRFKHLYRSQPSAENGLEGTTLRASYSFSNPDSFYYESVPLSDIASSVVEGLKQKSEDTTASFGPTLTVGASTANGDQGSAGVDTKSSNLFDQDRVARRYLKLYNQIIVSFEQVLESINGSVIGDRDGKFRFDYKTDVFHTPQGSEDPIDGRLNPRNVFQEVFNSARGGTNPIAIDESDNIVNPLTATTDALGRVLGRFLDPDDLEALIEFQRTLVHNEVDDRLLIRLNRIKRTLTGIIRYETSAIGHYKPMWSPHRFSRIYPEQTQAFTTLSPGVFSDESTGNVGVYTSGKVAGGSPFAFIKNVLGGVRRSTTGKVIGTISNPVLGVLENIQRASVRQRLPRARVWTYSMTGFEGITSKPALIATPLRLIDFPIDNLTRLPDTSQLFSQGGTFFDLNTGDVDLDTPPFKTGQQLSLGISDGQTSPLASPLTLSTGTLGGVFVDELLQGCVITFKNAQGSSITSGSDILVSTSSSSGTVFNPDSGDTIFVVPKSGSVALNDPLTQEDLKSLAGSVPTYRVGFDIEINRREGQFIDATLPSFEDPAIFASKELLGQNPPHPSSSLESLIQFSNQSTMPVLIPALQGLAKLDSGDLSLPYFSVRQSELEALEKAANAFTSIFLDSPNPSPPSYSVESIYPDETFDSQGVIASQLSPPLDSTEIASLVTTQDIFKRTSSGAYPPPQGHAGVGNLARYDLVFMQTNNSTPQGATGILSVGEVSGTSARGKIEPPRFITPVAQGMTLRYNLINGIVHESYPSYLKGFSVTEVVGATVLTTFDSSTIISATICYDNDSGGGALIPPIGGFNHFFSTAGNGAEIRLKLISKGGLDTDPQGTFASTATVVVRKIGGSLSVSGDNGGLFISANFVYFTNQSIQIDTPSTFFDFGRFDSLTAGATTVIQGLRGFAIDVQVPNATGVGSGGTSSIEEDRLTFTETFNLSSSRPRGTVHSSSGISLETTLDVEDVDIILSDASGGASSTFTTSVNNSTETNGGLPLSFLSRGVTPSSAYGVSFFTSGATPTDTGSFSRTKVMAFEGHGNTPITSNDIKFSATPSSPQGSSGPILAGKAVVDRFNYTTSYQNIVLPYEFTGVYETVEKGDICVVTSGQSEFPSAPTTTLKTGTYLIRGWVPPESSGSLSTVSEYKEVGLPPSTVAGGWLNFEYPKIVEFDSIAGTLTVDQMPQIVEVQDGVGNVISSRPIFETGGLHYLYIITDVSKVNANTDEEFNKTLVRFEYTTLIGNTFTLNMGTQTPASGTGGVDLSTIQVGQSVSGMRYLPLSLGQYGNLDLSGLSGWTGTSGPDWLFGFPGLTLSNDVLAGSPLNYPSDNTSVVSPALVYDETQVSSYRIGIYQGRPNSPSSFLSDLNSVVYPNVPKAIDLGSDLGVGNVAVNYTTLHPIPIGVSGSIVNCIIPSDKFGVLGGSNYRSRSGLFFEPSFPRPVNNLNSASHNVVSQAFGPLTEVGDRPLTITSGVPASGSVEAANFEVRRIRRFHKPLDDANEALIKLKSVYEIRRGTVSIGSYTQTGSYGVLVVDPYGPFSTATQIGDFTESLVNINSGDVFRLMANDGSLIEEVDILAVSGEKTLVLNSPSLQADINTTLNFEIYLKQAPVPHEQSNEGLLSLLTGEILLDRVVDYIGQGGGFVEYLPSPNLQVAYEQSANILRDTASVNFSQLGVRSGDYVLIDPSGELSGQSGQPAQVEFGARPLGDLGVLNRQSEPEVYVAGSPSELDDNRGYYRIESVSQDGLSLTVTASKNLLSGDIVTGDLVLDSSFVIYPTIHGSNLSLGIEGQNDLRPTSFAGQNGSPPNSFTGNHLSVGPFSYKIIRPSDSFSDESIELVLAMRERMLSWIEELRSALSGSKGGSYFIFQKDNHIEELGDLTNTLVGLGLISNAMIETLSGRVNLSPFSNTSDCLSILDRRFWVLDVRLDSLRPPYKPLSDTYASFISTGTGRPVLPDRIERSLNQSDNFRQSRYAWLDYRTNLITGLLSKINRFESDKERLKNEQKELMQQIGDTEQ